jgi:hypothetical protein
MESDSQSLSSDLEGFYQRWSEVALENLRLQAHHNDIQLEDWGMCNLREINPEEWDRVMGPRGFGNPCCEIPLPPNDLGPGTHRPRSGQVICLEDWEREHKAELSFPNHEIKPRGNRMNIKCAIFGHAWVTHNMIANSSNNPIYDMRMLLSLVLTLGSLGLLFPIVALFILPDDHLRDATCERCEKCKFEVTDRTKELEDKESHRVNLASRFEKLKKMRSKARG